MSLSYANLGQDKTESVNCVTYFKSCVTPSVYKDFNFVQLQFTYFMLHQMKDRVKGNWNELKGKLRQQFAVLTDNDLMYDEGKKDEMLGKLQIKLGKTKEELNKIISNF